MTSSSTRGQLMSGVWKTAIWFNCWKGEDSDSMLKQC